jgi:hypothetical protein
MPDAAPQPQATKTDTILAQEPLPTTAQALRQLGWIQGVDFFILGLIGMVGMTLAYWYIFSEPSPLQLLSCCLVAFCLLQLWTIILVFRCAHFVLMLSSYVNLMPEAAARMVTAFYSGRAMPASQKPK